MNTQLKKGVLELCVLSLLKTSDRYGYELVAEISKCIEISEGTIYPLLRRLKNEGYVQTYLEESSEGPPRKYYTLTLKGEKTREEFLSDWVSFINGVNTIIGGESREQE
ncbi:MAG: PadR family transcriptional regulator [Christensenellales bacterium]